MRLPESVTVKQLEARHPEWVALMPTWDTIADLREGAATLLTKREKYLLKRPGEREDLYRLRLEKFSYTPVLSTAIREFTSKLASAPLHVSGITQTASDTFWSDWMEKTDGDRQDHPELINELFSSLLYYGRAYVAVEAPRLTYQPRNRAEEPKDALPYAIVYDPQLVTNWGEDWYLTRQVDRIAMPLADPVQVATWVFWQPDRVVTYQAQVKLSPEGQILRVLVDGKWVSADLASAVVSQTQDAPHNLGRCPFVAAVLKPEDWLGSQAFLKQKQHLQIESAWTDSGTMAGIVQRIFVPPAPAPMDDPRVNYETPDYSEMHFDNQHVLVGSDFKFVESTGDAVANLGGQLDKIEHQIRSIASMGWLSSDTSVLEQSGKSKQVDQAILQDSLKKYGKTVLQLDQDILQLVARRAGRTDLPTVVGLDTYSTDTLDTILAATEPVSKVESRIPKTALKSFFGKLAGLLAGSVSPGDQAAIQEELEEIFSGDLEPLPGITGLTT